MLPMGQGPLVSIAELVQDKKAALSQEDITV